MVTIPYRTTHLTERRQLRAEFEAAWSRVGGAMVNGGPAHFAGFGGAMSALLLDGVWADVRELERAARTVGTAGVWQNVAAGLVWLARHQGAPESARTLVRDALPDGPRTEPGDSLFLAAVALQRVAAELALDAGDLSATRDWLTAHDRWLDWGGAVLGQAESHLLRARYHRAGGTLDEARRHTERALRRAGEPRQPLALLDAHRLLA